MTNKTLNLINFPTIKHPWSINAVFNDVDKSFNFTVYRLGKKLALFFNFEDAKMYIQERQIFTNEKAA
jgi:hypothetical protein